MSEIIALAMTQKAVDSMMSSSFKAGADASVSAGPTGVGAGTTPSSDFLSFSRSKGLYGGVDFSGAVIKPSEDFNKAYYGKDASPIDIIVKGAVHDPAAGAALTSKVAKFSGTT